MKYGLKNFIVKNKIFEISNQINGEPASSKFNRLKK